MDPDQSKKTLKSFKAYMRLNWKTGDIVVLKKAPGKIGPFEIPIELNLNITVPKKPEVKFTADIEIPETKIGEIVAEYV